MRSRGPGPSPAEVSRRRSLSPHAIPASGSAARYVVADITDAAQVEKAVDAAVGDIGRLDIAVNNAGYDGEYQLTRDYSTDMLDPGDRPQRTRGGCCR
ncbi:SDR family oxidoreductase [Streptomyces virginiae]|uniref:SDR family oxidoreductase n=1 Tax=Streptomyces virginiae TaxID=1961 RepID=UPI00344C9DED